MNVRLTALPMLPSVGCDQMRGLAHRPVSAIELLGDSTARQSTMAPEMSTADSIATAFVFDGSDTSWNASPPRYLQRDYISRLSGTLDVLFSLRKEHRYK